MKAAWEQHVSSGNPLFRMLLLLLVNGLFLAHTLSLQSKSCGPQCSGNGNCNKETGVCECRPGRQGPSCTIQVLSACRSSGSSAAVIGLGRSWPKSCLCWRQIFEWSLIPAEHNVSMSSGPNFRVKAGELLVNNGGGAVPYCYEKMEADGTVAGENEQFSDVPLANDTRFRYLRPLVTPTGDLIFLVQPRPNSIQVVDRSTTLLPLRYCRDRCNDRGACFADPLPRCVCRKGFRGKSCDGFYRVGEIANRLMSPGDPGFLACPNSCNTKASDEIRCIAGWCQCPEDQWGMDCGRSEPFNSSPHSSLQMQQRTRLLIYKYDLPWEVSFPFEFDDGWGTQDPMYSAETYFSKVLVSDSIHYTLDINAANLFYIPVFSRSYGQESALLRITIAMKYIREHYPLIWQRHKGRDHFMWLSDDIGACGLSDSEVGRLVWNPIKVVHFGLHRRAKGYAVHQIDNRSCYVAVKDVVVPSAVMSEIDAKTAKELSQNATRRSYLLYFWGSWRLNQMSYSGGARQAYHQHVHLLNDSRVKFGGGSKGYQLSEFCFVPYGEGWGNRLPPAVLHGCIPVVIQDRVHLELEDVLPYEEFTLRLRVVDVPDMLEILAQVTQLEIDRMRSKMREIQDAFFWERGMAYNFTLKSLHKRLHSLWAMHY